MLAYYFSIILNSFTTYYSQNYASIIYQGLVMTLHQKQVLCHTSMYKYVSSQSLHMFINFL